MSSSDQKQAQALELAKQAMTQARIALVTEHPFFGALALRLHLQVDPSCRDLWTNGRELGFNPAWVAVQSRQSLEAAQAHEMLHLACGHHVRRKGRDAERWNKACDFAVNLLLKEAGFTLPKGFEYDERYLDLSADEIFAVLPTLQDQDPHGGAKRALQERESSRFVDGAGQDLGGAASSAKTSEHGKADAAGKKSQGKGQKKSGQSGQDGEQGQGSEGAAFVGEVRDHPLLGGDSEERQGQKAAEQDARIALLMAMQRAFNQGDMPGRFRRMLKNLVHPKLDWRGLLQRFLEQCVDCDSTWTVPNRRYLHQGLYLPSRSEPNIPSICLAVDASGSIEEAKLARFCAELSSLLEAYDTTLTVIFHDSEVQEYHTFGRADLPLTLSPKGGGGTDYRPVCRWLEREGMSPSCLLWFTDLECSSFPEEPDYPVLWITAGRKDNPPPFGEWIVMN
ncbi:MAG: VWA-like domain-containing protein [Desulfovibrio sp.]|nr:VWA-like domain-containing protein [Desulfovibrio sp.]